MECFIDQQKYFFLILLIVCLCSMYAFITVIATETLTMSYTQHACDLFEIARWSKITFLKEMNWLIAFANMQVTLSISAGT